jgi:hypothetical protein
MADQQVIDTGTAPDAGNGDSLYVAFTKVNENFSNVWLAGPAGSNVNIANNTISTTNTNGNLILKPNGVGVIQIDNSLLPRINGVYSLGSETLGFRQGYFTDLTVTGNLVANINLSNVGNITSSGNITAQYFVGNGSQLTGLPAGYSNANVATLLASFGSNSISTTGNVTAEYFIGNGSLLSNLTIGAGSQILNGTSNVNVQQNSNVTVSVGGVNNVATFSVNGLTVPGTVNAGNVTGNGAGLSSVLTDRGADSSNWDLLTTIGVYKVNRGSWSGTTGTPLDSSVTVGILQVLTAIDSTTQVFFPGTVDSGDVKIQWNRSYWNGAWTAWIKIVNNGQVIDAGTY